MRDLEPIDSWVSYHVSLESRVLLVVRSVQIPAVTSTFTANEAWQMMRWRLLMVFDACRDVSERENPSRSAVQSWQQQQQCQLGLTSGKLLCQSLGIRSHARAVHPSYSKVWEVFLLDVTSGWEPQKKMRWTYLMVFWFAFNSQVGQSGYHYHVLTGRQFMNTWNGETISSEQQKPICTSQHTHKTNTPAARHRHCVPLPCFSSATVDQKHKKRQIPCTPQIDSTIELQIHTLHQPNMNFTKIEIDRKIDLTHLRRYDASLALVKLKIYTRYFHEDHKNPTRSQLDLFIRAKRKTKLESWHLIVQPKFPLIPDLDHFP